MKGKYDGRVVTQSVPKKDALSLAMGKPMFTDDKEFRNMVHVKVLYSPHAHAIIEKMEWMPCPSRKKMTLTTNLKTTA